MSVFNGITPHISGGHFRRSLALGAGFALIGLLPACQTLEGFKRDLSGKKGAAAPKTAGPTVRVTGATLEENSVGYGLARGQRTVPASSYSGPAQQRNQSYTVSSPLDTGRVPQLTGGFNDGALDTASINAPQTKIGTIEAYVTPLPVPQFIDIVFGEMLQVPFVIGKDVQTMTDVVQLRSSGRMKGTDFQILVAEALKEYGVRVVPENGSYKIIQDKALRSRIPRFIKSRAKSRTRADLRPVIQFVEMQAVDANSMFTLLKQTFADKKDTIRIETNQQNNFLTLSGLPEDVDIALSIITSLDELEYAGSQINKYTPQYWNVEEFSAVMENALKIEGWAVTSNPILSRTIFLMPVPYSNDLFVFAKTPQAHERVTHWLRELDRPVQGGDTKQIFIYQVKNVAAEELAQTANDVLAGGSLAAFAGAGGPNSGGSLQPQAASSGGTGGGLTSSLTRFTVDPSGNRIIFTGTSNDYAKLVALLEQLDTPAPEVLIELQIAEVTLTNDSNYGVDFNITDIGLGNITGTASTAGFGLSSNGLTVGLLGNDIEATLNAFASNRRVKILSTPILTARSGSEAELQVGQDIPVLSAQRAANNQNGIGATDILQSIDYRKTGVLVAIEPIVFSDNRIDLRISQEVSSAVDTANSTIASPTISNRSLTTQLSLEDGQTAVMGGLIQRSYTVDESGVPILKDIPLIGQAFSSDGLAQADTELVILITAYVLRGQNDKDQFVRRLSRDIDNSLADDSRIFTLLPRRF
jgi:general secretion pathway protein D